MKKKEVIAFLVKHKNSSFVLQTKKSLESSGFLISVYDTSESLFLSLASKKPKVVFVSNKYSETIIRNVTSRLKVQFKIKVVSLNEQLEDELNSEKAEKNKKLGEDKPSTKWGQPKAQKKKRSLWGKSSSSNDNNKNKTKKKLWEIKKSNNSKLGAGVETKSDDKIIISSSNHDQKSAKNINIVSRKSGPTQIKGKSLNHLKEKTLNKKNEKNSATKIKPNSLNQNNDQSNLDEKKPISNKPNKSEKKKDKNKIVIEKSTKLKVVNKTKHNSNKELEPSSPKSIKKGGAGTGRPQFESKAKGNKTFDNKKSIKPPMPLNKNNISDKDGPDSKGYEAKPKNLSNGQKKKGLKLEKEISSSQNNKTMPNIDYKKSSKLSVMKDNAARTEYSQAQRANNKLSKKSYNSDKAVSAIPKQGKLESLNKEFGSNNDLKSKKEKIKTNKKLKTPTFKETESTALNKETESVINSEETKNKKQATKPNIADKNNDSNLKANEKISKQNGNKSKADQELEISKTENNNLKKEKNTNKNKITTDAAVIINKKDELVNASRVKNSSTIASKHLTKILGLHEAKQSDEGSDCFLCSVEINNENGYLIIQTKNAKNIYKFIELQKDKIKINSLLLTDISKFNNLEEAFIGAYEFENLTNIYFIKMNKKEVSPSIKLENHCLDPKDLNFKERLDFALFIKLVNCNKMIKYVAPGGSLLQSQWKKLIDKKEKLHFHKEDKEKILLYLQLKKIKEEQKL